MLAKGDKSLKQSRLPTELFPIKKMNALVQAFVIALIISPK